MDLAGLLTILALGLLIGWLALTAHTAWMLTHPPRRGYAWAVSRGVPGDPSEVAVPGVGTRALPFTSWTLRSRGRDLPVWDVTGREPAGPTVVLTHGWGDSRVVALARLAALASGARRVVLWDSPGHGDAPGVCTLGVKEVADLRALLGRLAGDDAGPVVLYGSSLGAGVSLVVAAEPEGAPVAGVIAEAPYRVPFTPARNVLAVRGLPWRGTLPVAMAVLGLVFGQRLSWWPRVGGSAGGFDRAVHAAGVSVPLLVLHGAEDPVCPVADGRAVARAAGAGRIVEIAGGRHNDLWARPELAERCASAVRLFLREVRAGRPGEAGRLGGDGQTLGAAGAGTGR